MKSTGFAEMNSIIFESEQPNAMTRSLLYYEDDTLTPEARCLLWQWSRRIGSDNVITGTDSEIYERLELTKNEGKKALYSCLFKEPKAVVISTPASGESGSALNRYRINPDLQKDLETVTPQESPHIALIARLFLLKEPLKTSAAEVVGTVEKEEAINEEVASEGSCDKAGTSAKPSREASRFPNLLTGEARKARLVLANRWVLMVLLAHADASGTVMDLSYAQLQRLVGLSLSRLQSQLKKLEKLGILADCQSGRAGRLLGGKMAKIYRLNLLHSVFGSEARLAVQVELLPSDGDGKTIDLCEGMIDALFVMASCEERMKALVQQQNRELEKICDASERATFIARLSQAEKEVKSIKNKVRQLLPGDRYIAPMAAYLNGRYEERTAAWLRARVSGDAMRLLNSAWARLVDNKAGPEEPVESVIQGIFSAFPKMTASNLEQMPPESGNVKVLVDGNEEADGNTEKLPGYPPHVTLLYAMAHHLAKEMQICLRNFLNNHSDEEFDAMDFKLVPVEPSESTSGKVAYPFWRLCGLVLKEDEEKPLERIVVLHKYMPSSLRSEL